MANSRIQPDFKGFAALQNEPAKGSLDPNRKTEQAKADPAGKDDAAERKTLTISQYQDPRDELDHRRHAMFAKARGEKGLTSD